MCSNFFQRHHALGAHTTNFHTTAISRFPILSIKFVADFDSFCLTFSTLIFCIQAGWPNFFPASLKSGYNIRMYMLNQYISVRGPLRECRSIQSGASGLPYYCTPLVCISVVIGSLTVWQHNKPKPKPIG